MPASRRMDELARCRSALPASSEIKKKKPKTTQQKPQLGFLKRVPLLQEPLPGFSQKLCLGWRDWDCSSGWGEPRCRGRGGGAGRFLVSKMYMGRRKRLGNASGH